MVIPILVIIKSTISITINIIRLFPTTNAFIISGNQKRYYNNDNNNKNANNNGNYDPDENGDNNDYDDI